MIGLIDYARMKDNYCICYFGPAKEYLLQLKLLRPFLENTFPGLNIFIGCSDEFYPVLGNSDKIVRFSDLKDKKPCFAHIFEVKCDGVCHPLEQFMTAAGLTHYPVITNFVKVTNSCSIIKDSTYPTKPLTVKQVDILEKYAKNKGLVIIENGESVLGVESYELVEAASKGHYSVLVPTGVGTKLMKKMFPKMEILDI